MEERINSFFLVSFLLRVGLAVVFLYAAVSSFLNPDAWVGFLPLWLRDVVPSGLLLNGFSLFQVALSLWLLSNKKIFIAGIVSSATMLAIIITNLGALDIIFRDTAIFFMALALVALTYRT